MRSVSTRGSSTSWKWTVRRVTLSEQADRLAARKRELGSTVDALVRLARKDGRARTPEKRKLLRFLEEEARRSGARAVGRLPLLTSLPLPYVRSLVSANGTNCGPPWGRSRQRSRYSRLCISVSRLTVRRNSKAPSPRG